MDGQHESLQQGHRAPLRAGCVTRENAIDVGEGNKGSAFQAEGTA